MFKKILLSENQKNIINYISAFLFEKGFYIILFIFINTAVIRYLGPDKFGLITFFKSLFAILIPIGRLGLDETLINKLIKEEKDKNSILSNAIISQFVFGLLLTFLFWIYIILNYQNDNSKLIIGLLISSSLVFNTCEASYYWFEAKGRILSSSITNSLIFIALGILRLVFINQKLDVEFFALIILMESILLFFGRIILIKKAIFLKLRNSFSLKKCRRLVLNSWPMIISNTLNTQIFNFTIIMIGLFGENSKVGYFGAAMILMNGIDLIPKAFSRSLRPRLYKILNEDKDQFNKVFIKYHSIFILFGILISVFLFFTASPIINLLFGKDYDPAIKVIVIILWTIVPLFSEYLQNLWFIRRDDLQGINFKLVTSFLILCSLNFYLIPKYGIYGASYAFLISNFWRSYFSLLILPKTRELINLINKSLTLKSFKAIL